MKRIMIVVAFLALSGASFAQTNVPAKADQIAAMPASDLMKKFIGTWMGEGTVMGAESKIVMTWENVLEDKFTKLTFRNVMKTKDGGTQIFEGNAYYKVVGGKKCQGSWFDTSGDTLPIDSTVEGNALDSAWGTEGTRLGRTIYRLVDDKKMEVVDSMKLRDGTWREFGRSVFVKKG